MADEWTCVRCGGAGPRLTRAPKAGALGEAILAQVCDPCWSEWLQVQLTIMNHYGLQPVDPADRAQINQALREFLSLHES